VRRTVKITSLVATAVLLLIGIAVPSVYQASKSVPEFYQAAVALEPEAQEDERDAFVARATALASDLNGQGRWQSLFTADEINAWLALELSTKYPQLLPAGVRDPRVSITAEGATLGCLYRSGEIDSVVTVTFEAYLHSPHVVAIRISHARAGALPVPLGLILDGISNVARDLNLRLEWRKAQGDPVALITLPPLGDGPRESMRLDSIELREGELFVAGTVGRSPLESQPIVSEPLIVPTAKKDADPAQPRVGSSEKDTLQK
jgi:hypothetical protein